MDKGVKLSMTYNLNLLAFLISLIGQGDQEGQVGQGSSIGKPEPFGVPTTADGGRHKAIHGQFIVLNVKGPKGLKHRISSPRSSASAHMGEITRARGSELSVLLSVNPKSRKINN